MAADAYIKTAASNLRGAVSDLQSQVHSIQADIERAKWQLKTEISSAQNEQTMLKAELMSTTEAGRKQEVQRSLQQVEQNMHDKQRQLDQKSMEAADAVQSKNSFLAELQNKASELESLAASAI